MPRPYKFPGLQTKFELGLQDALSRGAMGTAELKVFFDTEAPRLNLSSDEVAELNKNFANYIARAKDADLIRSGGSWSGYQLVRVKPEPEQAADTKATAADERPPRRPSEAAAHFPATIALSLHFGGRVLSLPTAVDTISWGNADMLMLRGNSSRRRLEDNQLDADVLRLADSSPECILTSIELKYGLERVRKQWFQAVAEAAANSRWANESILVHVSSENQTEPLDEEVVSLARSAEIGIIEISVAESSDRRMLETRILSAAPHRPFLRLSELSGSRIGLLREAHALLNSWNADMVTFLDEEGASAKLLRLVRQALENLRRQSSFLPQQGLVNALRPFLNELRIRDFYRGALDAAASQTDTALDFRAADTAFKNAMNELTMKEHKALQDDLQALDSFTNKTETTGAG